MAEVSEVWEHPDPKPIYFALADLFRLDPRIEKHISTEGACWIWTGYSYTGEWRLARYGHGWWKAFKCTGLMHRYTYILAWVTIGKGRELHHTCENTLCINPNHLWSVTRQEHLYIHGGAWN